MKMYGEVEVYSTLLTTALGGDECSASDPGHFTPVNEPPLPIGYGSVWASKPVFVMYNIPSI
jgi:hypothetical protein